MSMVRRTMRRCGRSRAGPAAQARPHATVFTGDSRARRSRRAVPLRSAENPLSRIIWLPEAKTAAGLPRAGQASPYSWISSAKLRLRCLASPSPAVSTVQSPSRTKA
jgi:hypothetical protein